MVKESTNILMEISQLDQTIMSMRSSKQSSKM